MALDFYKLREQPFGVTPNPRYLYPTRTHRECLASLICGIENGAGFSTLISEPGMGKTTLLVDLVKTYQEVAPTAYIFNTQCTGRELLRQIAEEFHLSASQSNFAQLHNELKMFLVRHASIHPVLVVVDEAHNLEESALETVRLLSNFELPEQKLLHIALAGQSGLAEKLRSPSLTQLKQRITIMTHLRPLSQEEVAGYVEHRLRCSGYSGPALFSPKALMKITEVSNGIPRLINQICFNALLLGSSLKCTRIGAEIIDEVAADLQLNVRAGSRWSGYDLADRRGKAGISRFSNSQPSTWPEEASSEDPRASSRVSAPGMAHEQSGDTDGGRHTKFASAAANSSRHLSSESPEPNGTAAEHAPEHQAMAGGPQLVATVERPDTPNPEQHGEKRISELSIDPFRFDRSRLAKAMAIAAGCLLVALLVALLIWRNPERWSTAARFGDSSPAIVPAESSTAHTEASTDEAARIAETSDDNGDDKGMSPSPQRSSIKPRENTRKGAAPTKKEDSTESTEEDASDVTVTHVPIQIRRGEALPAEEVQASEMVPPTIQPANDSVGLEMSTTLATPSLDSAAATPGAPAETRSGELISSTKPVYPREALALRREGAVVLELEVDAGGKVSGVRTISGDPVLAVAATQAVRRWRYRPYEVDGKPSPMRAGVTIEFKLAR
ncbi:MAG TPA: TonB family protein [Terriglobales bacterium]|nr:TonB family protein [Terriglobales bacterium]